MTSSIELPFPISLWKAHGRDPATQKQYRTHEYQNYIDTCLWILRSKQFTLPRAECFIVRIDLVHPEWRCLNGKIAKKDLDNFLKVPLDTLTTYLKGLSPQFDDSLITTIVARKMLGKKPACFITIEKEDFL